MIRIALVPEQRQQIAVVACDNRFGFAAAAMHVHHPSAVLESLQHAVRILFHERSVPGRPVHLAGRLADDVERTPAERVAAWRLC